MQNIDIFPWNAHFDTGIEMIDTQHSQLVSILNRLATSIAFKSHKDELSALFDELTKYAIYHFQAEEAIWQKYLSGSSLDIKHHANHQEFMDTIFKLKAKQDDCSIIGLAEETLDFLVRWLVLQKLVPDALLCKNLNFPPSLSRLTECPLSSKTFFSDRKLVSKLVSGKIGVRHQNGRKRAKKYHTKYVS